MQCYFQTFLYIMNQFGYQIVYFISGRTQLQCLSKNVVIGSNYMNAILLSFALLNRDTFENCF